VERILINTIKVCRHFAEKEAEDYCEVLGMQKSVHQTYVVYLIEQLVTQEDEFTASLIEQQMRKETKL